MTEQSSEEEQQKRHAAIIEFIGSFKLAGPAPNSLSDLSDGVAFFEALSEM